MSNKLDDDFWSKFGTDVNGLESLETGNIKKVTEPINKTLDSLRSDYIKIFNIKELDPKEVYKTYNKYSYKIKSILTDIEEFGFINLVNTDKLILESGLENLLKLMEVRKLEAIEIMDKRRVEL